ncbi:hypothetical protein RJ639_012533 [Escallonia herrerae]|uniref:Pectinesterase inhibitor domain-containing protein n=1 Tax=Escallonia herrerae TaxID=1293975 RepID=A0AA88VMP0_9ASTE|nr:hypothetical protein RJ639_012533 [Escallonia herrerae]
MDIPITRSILLISLLLVLSLIGPSFARPNTNADSDDLVTNVCKKHENPGFCIDALKSDPRANTDDLKVLANISLELATFNATGTKVKIHSLLLASRDPVLTDHLNKCADSYDIAVYYLGSAQESLKSGDYLDLQVLAAGAADMASDCENTFKGPPPYPSPLSTDNSNTWLLGEITVVITNLLGVDGQ